MLSLCVAQEMGDDVIAISLKQNHTAARFALHLLWLVTEHVTLVGRTRLDLAIGGHAETLLGPGMGLDLGHVFVLSIDIDGEAMPCDSCSFWQETTPTQPHKRLNAPDLEMGFIGKAHNNCNSKGVKECHIA